MAPYRYGLSCWDQTQTSKGPSTLATLFNHMWPHIVAGIFIPVGNHYFQALTSTLQFVAQVCDRLWLVPATDRAFAYITYMSPPHVALVCSGPPQCAATCGWTKWPVCSGPNSDPNVSHYKRLNSISRRLSVTDHSNERDLVSSSRCTLMDIR